MQVLVTGSTSHLGWELCRQLTRSGHMVKALCRQRPNIQTIEGLEWVKGDVLHLASLTEASKGCQGIYHLAATGSREPDKPERVFAVNVDGTENVLKAASGCGVGRVVFTSCSSVMGQSFGLPFEEDDARLFSFDNDFDLAKHLAEKKVQEYVRNGGDAVIVMPSALFGPGMPSKHSLVMHMMRQTMRSRNCFVPGNPDVVTNFAFTEDVVQGHLLAMQHGAIGERYLLGGANVSIRQLMQMVTELAGLRRKILRVPNALLPMFDLIHTGRSRLTGGKPVITRHARQRLFQQHRFCSGKATRDIGYAITPLAEAVSKTIAQWVPEAAMPSIPVIQTATVNQSLEHEQQLRNYNRGR